ncbi:ABC-three component system protein [Cellulosilyticum sp. WCF-2]|uniref:ABC-three component system protein n=1 Tax=Cellulosilyticum sp. WCF-2 TaxID=2497860 RepID=UPI000F8E2C18|nr:ABC-three component system protein [Cellulosilyticum sp. WCF-2]QEH69965.1 restriction endonuclease [Cellulosilyticum sp. WCF-2]
MDVIPLPNNEVPRDTSRIFDLSIDPLVRLRTIEAGEFEDIVCQWASGYLSKCENYKNIVQIGGSKDSGRDIVAYLDESLQQFDIFQCKRYKEPLTPSTYLSEFGKLCYYTMIGKYNMPRKYFIVASNGIGQDLRELVEHPQKINTQLIMNWDKYCKPKKKIIAEGVLLSDELKEYILKFDFSIVSEVSPQSLLEQFATTVWYKYHFGGGIHQRSRMQKPQEELKIEEVKMEYINQLMKVYSNHENRNIEEIENLKTIKKLYRHFMRQRESFYNACALKRFARDEFINDEVYEDLKNQIYHGVVNICESSFEDDLKRVDETIERAQILPIQVTELNDISILEKSGICHDLVNDKELRWIEDDKEESDI